ncbi:hypothetical protein CAPTEDRAFT_226468 [Capitella teleta]|uniref:THAP-type domain-containing protein n=1 Tax=Capitella teleta TaxID=283909 RepID=R7UMK4_CAPTE|nr:hypothetical protein CAPTEDRAFT_226468 [Capitella teleta]|eukprot:ELU07455.1 hypothetical protein CAPTEDRAFT_226468 [Capitella teleta]
MPTNCAVVGCTMKERTLFNDNVKKISYHMFPKNPALKAKWISAIRRENYIPGEWSTVCSRHFEDEDEDRTSALHVRLRENAVPSLSVTHSTQPIIPSSLHPSLVGSIKQEVTTAEESSETSQSEQSKQDSIWEEYRNLTSISSNLETHQVKFREDEAFIKKGPSLTLPLRSDVLPPTKQRLESPSRSPSDSEHVPNLFLNFSQKSPAITSKSDSDLCLVKRNHSPPVVQSSNEQTEKSADESLVSHVSHVTEKKVRHAAVQTNVIVRGIFCLRGTQTEPIGSPSERSALQDKLHAQCISARISESNLKHSRQLNQQLQADLNQVRTENRQLQDELSRVRILYAEALEAKNTATSCEEKPRLSELPPPSDILSSEVVDGITIKTEKDVSESSDSFSVGDSLWATDVRMETECSSAAGSCGDAWLPKPRDVKTEPVEAAESPVPATMHISVEYARKLEEELQTLRTQLSSAETHKKECANFRSKNRSLKEENSSLRKELSTLQKWRSKHARQKSAPYIPLSSCALVKIANVPATSVKLTSESKNRVLNNKPTA